MYIKYTHNTTNLYTANTLIKGTSIIHVLVGISGRKYMPRHFITRRIVLLIIKCISHVNSITRRLPLDARNNKNNKQTNNKTMT